MIQLPSDEFRLFRTLGSHPEPLSVAAAAAASHLDQSRVMAAAVALQRRGLLAIQEESEELFSITDAGLAVARLPQWPEESAFAKIQEQGTRLRLQELPRLLAKPDVRAEVKWLIRRGWCHRDGDFLVITDKGRAESGTTGVLPDKEFIALLARSGAESESAAGAPERRWLPASYLRRELALQGLDLAAALASLQGRGELFKRRYHTVRNLSLTEEGRRIWNAGQSEVQEAVAVTQLTPELLVSGKWREVTFKRYDVTLATERRYPGKPHPLQRIIQETRRAFLEMGFEEVASPVVETAFWDFDALFQPQDHPAREIQDTFYLAQPAVGQLPDEELVRRVARTHEDGGDTGSTGWRYQWDIAQAQRLVLRTHTTATTIRALAENPRPPRKVFCVGKTFRRENIDPTHLPEFYQIDGIVIDEQASLASLFGTLTEFYRKMGASEVRFRPAYFPYTEPSAEVFGRLGPLGWVEMGGCGVFRPEVTHPLGCRTTVLAWGLGLERLAMLRFGVDDIRKLYWADINWLREARLSQ